MSEEVEVHVRQIDETDTTAETPPAAEIFRRLLLASIGAFAMTYDEIERFTQRLIERGELAQKDGEKVMRELSERFQVKSAQETQQAEVTAQNLGNKLEDGLDQMLNRLSIPSKRDIDELSAKIAQLAARVEELRQQPAQAETTSSTASSKSKS